MELKRKGYTLKLYEDELENPRVANKDTNIGRMVFFHKKYRNLGEEHCFKSPGEFLDYIQYNAKDIPSNMYVYIYDHSGISLSTHPFNDDFDSGFLGFIYCSTETISKLGLDGLNDYDEILDRLEKEVEDYSNYLGGFPPVYGYEITDEDDNTVENMGGFELTTFEDMLKEMKGQCSEKFEFLFDTAIKKQKENCL